MQALPSSIATPLDFRFQLFGGAGTTVANLLRQGGHDNALLRADLSSGWAGSRRPRPLRDRSGCLSDLLDSLPHRCRHARRASGLAERPSGTGSLMEVGYKRPALLSGVTPTVVADPLAAAIMARNGALAALTALLLGLVGSVVGGWMASGEPMTFTYHPIRAAFVAGGSK